MAKNSNDVDQTAVNNATKALEDAIKALDRIQLNKTALEAAIKKYDDIKAKKDLYTPDTWNIATDAYNTAIGLRNNDAVSQDTITNAAKALEKAITDLVKVTVNKDELKTLVSDISKLNSDDYTKVSWDALQTVLESNEVQTAINNNNILQENLDNAVKALRDKVNALEINKSALSALIAEIGTLNQADYTSETWSTFRDKLDEAKGLITSTTATKSNIDNAVAELRAAFNGLKVDKIELNTLIDDLQELIDRVSKLDTTIYTEESVEQLNAAVNAAIIILEKEDANEEEVEEAQNAIQVAMDNIETIEEEITPDDDKKTEGGSDSNDDKTPKDGLDSDYDKTPEDGTDSKGHETPGNETDSEDKSKAENVVIPGDNSAGTTTTNTLPNTGGASATAVGFLGTILALAGGFFARKKRK